MTTTILAGAVAALALAVAAPAGCKKHTSGPPPDDQAKPPRNPAEHGPNDRSIGGGNPHAGMNMGESPHAGASMGESPHAGMSMGQNPHGGMASMGGAGKAGSTLERTAGGRAVLGPLTLVVPKRWKERPTQSGMRAAEFTIPGVKGAGDGELVIYYFGQHGAGSPEDNIARWSQQFVGPGGQPATPVVQKKKVAGMAMTQAELTGRYVSSMSPGGKTEKHDSVDWSMVGGVLASPGGPYYFKMTGPKATMATAKKEFAAMLSSIKKKAG